jgi:hypothetical protein
VHALATFETRAAATFSRARGVYRLSAGSGFNVTRQLPTRPMGDQLARVPVRRAGGWSGWLTIDALAAQAQSRQAA